MSLSRPALSAISGQMYGTIIIGGGISGAGIALDLASRGQRVIVVEKGDFASGTSSKTTKLIHGGLRYLENLQFGVTLESVREREIQQHLAPHMVWSLPFVIPTYSHSRFKNLQVGLGLWVYDLMAGLGRKSPFHRSAGKDEILQLCPGIEAAGLTGGYIYQDCRTDDSRHVLEVLRGAARHGAVVLNYTAVTKLIRRKGQVIGVEVERRIPLNDVACSRTVLYAHTVVNATGVWSQQVSELSGGKSTVEVVPAKGVHFTLSPQRLPLKAAMFMATPDGRYCFAVPWYDAIVVGTTDSAYQGNLDKVDLDSSEINYLLGVINHHFPHAKITTADITGSFAGLRPLIRQPGSKSTSELSRRHTLVQSDDGLINLAGGKLTTYRQMAEDAADLIAKITDPEGTQLTACATKTLRLAGWSKDDDVPQHIEQLRQAALKLGLGEDTAAYLPTVYGKFTKQVLQLAAKPNLSARLSAKHPYITAQVVYAVQEEAAATIEDVLSRRIRLTITDRQAALEAAPLVAKLMTAELGWTKQQEAAHLELFASST